MVPVNTNHNSSVEHIRGVGVKHNKLDFKVRKNKYTCCWKFTKHVALGNRHTINISSVSQSRSSQ